MAEATPHAARKASEDKAPLARAAPAAGGATSALTALRKCPLSIMTNRMKMWWKDALEILTFSALAWPWASLTFVAS